MSSLCCLMIVSSRFLRRGWIRPGLRPPKTATPYETNSDGYPRRISQVCLLPIFNLTSFRLALAVDRELYFLITNIAPEEARGDSLKDALVIYRHFCDILKSRYGKPKQRRNKGGYYRSTYVTSRGVGISIGGNRSLIDCYVKSPE